MIDVMHCVALGVVETEGDEESEENESEEHEPEEELDPLDPMDLEWSYIADRDPFPGWAPGTMLLEAWSVYGPQTEEEAMLEAMIL